MIESLVKDGVYTLIGTGNRKSDQPGGLFEVYKSTATNEQKFESVQNALKNEGFLFIDVGCINLQNSILQTRVTDQSRFNRIQYLIREKNTLRVPNCDEATALAESARDVAVKTSKTAEVVEPTTSKTTGGVASTTPKTTEDVAPTTPKMTNIVGPTTSKTTEGVAPTTPKTTNIVGPTTPKTTNIVGPTTPKTTNIVGPTTSKTTDGVAPTTSKTAKVVTPTNTDKYTSEPVLSEDPETLSLKVKNISLTSNSSIMIEQNNINKIMRSSYGRMAMAYQRGKNRYDKLVKMYNEIFHFTFQQLTKKKEIQVSVYGLEKPIPYENCYHVELNNGHVPPLQLKKVFEILQVYNSSDENLHGDNNRNVIDGTVPLLVNLNIGGKVRQFLLCRWPHGESNNQLLVSVLVSSKNNVYYFQGHPYRDLIKGFDSYTAKCMIACLDALTNNQPDLPEVMPWKNIVEFLALTQIAESNHGRRDYNKSRTLGMNKLARQLLRSIAKEAVTFNETFGSNNDNTTSYPPILGGGTERARYAVRHVTRRTVVIEYKTKQDKRVEVCPCNELSEDSDEDK